MFPIRHRLVFIAIVGGVVGLGAGSAHAVIQYSTDQRNTAPAPDSIAFPAWQWQGVFGSFLATAIGPNHIVTAQHTLGDPGNLVRDFHYNGMVFQTDPTFNGVGYASDPDSDLLVFRVTESLPAWATLYTSNDEQNKALVTVGRGTQRGEPLLVNGVQKGWLWGADDRVQSWGQNQLIAPVADFENGLGEMLRFDFSATAGDTALSQGDSGGGTFVQHNGQWKLAGINYAAEAQFKLTVGGTTLFASVYDRSGLLYADGTPAPQGPSMSYATRISSNLDFLYQFVEAPPVVLASYAVNGRDDVGDVDVAGEVSVGPLAKLKAYHVRSESLSLGSNATVIIKPNGQDRGVSKVSQLTLGTNAKLNLNDNDLIVQATDLTQQMMLIQVEAWVKSARNNVIAWKGPGIGSTAAHDDPSGKMVLGVAPNRNGSGGAIYDLWGGLDVDENSILVKYTRAGDLNLDGSISIADYLRIDRAMTSGASGYWNGDVTYDGTIDASDFFLMDMNYLDQFASPLAGGAAAEAAPGVGAVPEPGAMAVLALGAMGLLRRRR